VELNSRNLGSRCEAVIAVLQGLMSSEVELVPGGATVDVTGSELAEVCQQSHVSVTGCNIMLIIRAEVWLVQSRGAKNGSRLWQGGCKGSGDIPSCTASLVSSRRPPNIYIIHEGCCYVRHLILYDKQNVPLQDLDRICGPHW